MELGRMKDNRLLLGIVLSLFLVVLAAALYKAWPLLFPEPQTTLPLDPNCNLRTGSCVSLDEKGYSVSLSIEPKHLPLLDPLSLRVGIEGVTAKSVAIDFSGVDMYMGYNRFSLDSVGDGLYIGEGRLPVCTQESMIWEAKVMVEAPDGLLVAPFRFVTYRDPDKAPAPASPTVAEPVSEPPAEELEPEIPRAVFRPGMEEPELLSGEDTIPAEAIPDSMPLDPLTPSLPPAEAPAVPSVKLSPPASQTPEATVKPDSKPKPSPTVSKKAAAPQKPVAKPTKKPVSKKSPSKKPGLPKKSAAPAKKPAPSKSVTPPPTPMPNPEMSAGMASEKTVPPPVASTPPVPARHQQAPSWDLGLPTHRRYSKKPAPKKPKAAPVAPVASPFVPPSPTTVEPAGSAPVPPAEAPSTAVVPEAASASVISEPAPPPPAPKPKKTAQDWDLGLP
jgi:hypothetical protein